MRSKAFNIGVLLLLLATSAFSQYRLMGTISADDSTLVKGVSIFLSDGSESISDRQGKFLFEDLSNGDYTLHFTSEDYEYHNQSVRIDGRDQTLRVRLKARNNVLEEVTVSDARSDFGFTKMRSVEKMGIYEGKKTEVIIPSQLTANLATNNARQIFSRVAGLNIWENDGGGLQLSIGGRGLDPNRTSNFNVRQNGYDISADALGYPESYYTPPLEGIGRIEIVRGAASLQYGTQFGGLINFTMKEPVSDRKFELTARQTGGSFGFYNTFTSISGTTKKLSYYSFYQYKRGDGWRENSHFDNHNVYTNVNYAFSENTRIGVDLTHTRYLAQQPGGLTDEMFNDDPRQSNRERNWFDVNWNMAALHLDHKFNSSSEFNLRMFGLIASRYSLGFRPHRVANVDENEERDLIKGNFKNWGMEARFLKRYEIVKKPSVLLLGSRYYSGFNHSRQGFGSTAKDADFKFLNEDEDISYDYEFPNQNTAFFIENIFYLNDKLSITPGLRYEHINTTAEGYYGTIYKDLAGNVIERTRTDERRKNIRQFMLAGIGVSYKPTPHMEIYTNLSQNYKSITFNDMRVANPSSDVDPNLGDEKGYSFDLGLRTDQTVMFNYDVSFFFMNYNDRIGDIIYYTENDQVKRRRSNVGQAIISGIEAYGEMDVFGLLRPHQDRWSLVGFANVAFIRSNYKTSNSPNVEGKKVEFIPDINLKSGIRLGYRNFKTSLQYTYMAEQFTDATNQVESDYSAVIGLIPEYSILDLSMSYEFKRYRVEGSINNLTDQMYYTRRATGYPGPGILPSDGRGFFLTLQIKL
jgi:Fe(3+) dicitrate transport protein